MKCSVNQTVKIAAVGLRDERRADPTVFLALCSMLLALGTLMVFSSSMSSTSTVRDQFFFSRHLVFLGLSIVAGLLAAAVPIQLWYRAAPLLFVVSLGLLAAVLVPGVGHEVNGAQRWLRVVSISIQPSELCKLTFPLFVCWWLFDRKGQQRIRSVASLLVPTSLICLGLALTALEPDLGTTLFLGCAFALTLFLAGFPLRIFLVGTLIGFPVLGGMLVMKPYQLERINGFLRTWTTPEAAPYQVRQSLTTLGVGGFSGTGLGRGWQKLSFLPEANTDFVVAVVGEELGFLGAAGVGVLWVAIYVSGMQLIRNIRPMSFASVLATVLLAQLVLQAALNVAVVTAMVPPKGISHPFVSYGGSSLVTSVTALGMILSLTRPVQQLQITDASEFQIEKQPSPVEHDRLAEF